MRAFYMFAIAALTTALFSSTAFSLEMTVHDNRSAEALTESPSFSEDEFETKEYLYDTGYGSTLAFVIVKNNSEATVEVEGSASAKDTDGNSLGTTNASIDVLGPDETSIACFYFSGVEGAASVDYNLEYSASEYYLPVLSNISAEATVNDENVTLLLTNNGSYAADFVEAYALFFDSDSNVVSYASEYFIDGDDELKPGATLSGQLDAYKAYDHFECYLTGRHSRSASGEDTSSASEIIDDDFDITERLYESSGASYDFLIITNNSDKNVEIYGNGTACDTSENILGASDMSIDILGPGETSIGYFFFNNVSGVDHVNYTLSYDTDSYYSPVLSNLSVDQTINTENVILSISNNGSEAAQFVEAYALFCDADNNVIYYTSTYIDDDDNEIKPGATISGQLNSYKSFDHVDCYFTGRRH